MKLWNFIKEGMMKNPSQIICEDNAEMTYENMVAFAEVFSEKLKSQKCCAILCSSEMASAMALLSCFAAGVTAVPLSGRYGYMHCEKIIEMIGPTAIISDTCGTLEVTPIAYATYNEPDIHPALIMCTSGTTGKPKGAMLTEDNIISNVTDVCSYFDIDEKDSILIARPLYHCAVLSGEFLTSLLKGIKIRFYSKEFNPKEILNLAIDKHITVLCGTPTQLSMLGRFNHKYSGCCIRTICISGECVEKETAIQISWAFPYIDIYHVYGLTEASPRVSYLPPYLFHSYADCVGIPLDSVTLKIVKTDGAIADIGEEGILWIKGDNVMAGYYNSPKETEEVLKDGWLCTKDIALINEKGLLKIRGRSDDLIIRAGMNIYPVEIENELRKDIRVREAFAYKLQTTHMGTQIGLKIAGDFKNVNEVKELCAKVLPKHQMPLVIEIVDSLPKNASGKIIRHE